MQKQLKIAFTYDVKEDYRFERTCWKHTDFSTLAEVSYVKGLFEKLGHTVYLIGNYEKLNNCLASRTFPDVDIVFNIAEGVSSRNREGWIPSLLEINHIPYTGSDAYGLSVTLSKIHTKIIANYLGIPTPQYCAISSLMDIHGAPKKVLGPWILKPNYEGSSSGVMLAKAITGYKTRDSIAKHFPTVCGGRYNKATVARILAGGEKGDCYGTRKRRLRAKRETDFVRMRSIFPRLQSAIMRLNSVLRFMLVPVIPSSA